MNRIQFSIEKKTHDTFTELSRINRSLHIRQLMQAFVLGSITPEMLGDISYHINNDVEKHRTAIDVHQILYSDFIEKCDQLGLNYSAVIRSLINFEIGVMKDEYSV